MNKKDLLIQLHGHLQQEIDATMAAVNEAHALASHEQSKPENQYDTLALEAAYLAHGQSERIAELQRQVMILNHFELLDFSGDSQVVLGAVVCLADSTGETQWLWLLPVSGGFVLSSDEHEIRTITPEAPLGKKLLANELEVGDEIELQLGHIKKQFEILELL